MKKIWTLPLGDLYEIYHTQTPSGANYYISMIKRENETTVCCQGTPSMRVIQQYYEEVSLAQKDRMNSDYWKKYKKRMELKSSVE